MIIATDPSPLRAAIVVLALECAIAECDEEAFAELVEGWRTEHPQSSHIDVVRLCHSLLKGPHTAWALMLADAEVARTRSAASHVLRAKAREVRSDIDTALDDLREAVRLSQLEEDRVNADVARLELIRLLARHPASALEAARIARDIEVEPTSKRALLALSIARLGESGRYARVRGLDMLSEFMRDSEPTIAHAALDALVSHVDTSGRTLTEIELDRVRNAIEHWPHRGERSELSATLERVHTYWRSDDSARSALVRAEYDAHILARAQSVLEGHDVSPEPSKKDETSTGFAAIAALGRGRDDEAKKRLEELSELPLEGVPSTWTAAWMGLDNLATQKTALALTATLLRLQSSPPRGFLALARHLEFANAPHLARLAIMRAEAQRENGARDQRIDAWRRAAWEAHAHGDRDEAIRCLLNAKG